MSKEDMVKEAVEEAKAKAAKEQAEAEETVETEDAQEVETEAKEATEEATETEGDSEAPSEGKKKFFGKKENKDKKDEKIEERTDRVTRQMAEFDNFRKRTIKEKAVMYDDGVRSTIEKLLTVIDNLERAVAVQEGKVDADDAFFKGVKMTLVQFREILHSMGVEEIKALGEKFDPNLHAAVAHEDDESYGENEVILEMLKG